MCAPTRSQTYFCSIVVRNAFQQTIPNSINVKKIIEWSYGGYSPINRQWLTTWWTQLMLSHATNMLLTKIWFYLLSMSICLFFKEKTITRTMFCLADKEQLCTPSCAQKLQLFQNGLGEKRVVIPSLASKTIVKTVLFEYVLFLILVFPPTLVFRMLLTRILYYGIV